MPRSFSAALQEVINAQYSSVAMLVLVEIRHQDLGAPIRLANNTEDVISNGDTFIGFPFEIELPGDEDGPPRGSLTVQNVDRRIGQAIIDLQTPPRLRLMVVLSTDLDTPFLDFKHFYFRNIRGNASQLSGDIDSWDMPTEPWPARRADKARCPALYR